MPTTNSTAADNRCRQLVAFHPSWASVEASQGSSADGSTAIRSSARGSWWESAILGNLSRSCRQRSRDDAVILLTATPPRWPAERLAAGRPRAVRPVLPCAGLIDRRAHPTSRRELVAELTARGRRVVQKVTANRRNELARVVEKMPARERRGLVRALAAFTAAGGEPSYVDVE